MNEPDDKTAPARSRMRWVQVSGFAIGVCLLAVDPAIAAPPAPTFEKPWYVPEYFSITNRLDVLWRARRDETGHWIDILWL
jgi:hypothetical protein